MRVHACYMHTVIHARAYMYACIHKIRTYIHIHAYRKSCIHTYIQTYMPAMYLCMYVVCMSSNHIISYIRVFIWVCICYVTYVCNVSVYGQDKYVCIFHACMHVVCTMLKGTVCMPIRVLCKCVRSCLCVCMCILIDCFCMSEITETPVK